MILPVPDPAAQILNRFRQTGIPAYVVGGAVRDCLNQTVCKDIDILALTRLERVTSLFADQQVKVAGAVFQICLVNGIEVSVPRNSSGADRPVSDPLISDLACRDFTINAMAWDPDTGAVIDPFNGKQDLEDRVIRFTGNPEDRIAEDPVRMVRACRFAAGLDGTVESGSFDAIFRFKNLIGSHTAEERLRAEIVKAMDMDRPSLFFWLLQSAGLLEKIFPSLSRCHDLDGGPFHGETVFEHCMLVGDGLPARQPLLRLAGFLHDTGKFDAAAVRDGKLTFRGHEKFFQAAEQDLEQLRFSNRDTAYMISLIKAHMRPLNAESTPRAVRRLLAMLKEYHLDYRDFFRMRICDRKSNLKKDPYTLAEIRVRLGKLKSEIRKKAVLTMNDLAISGRQIMEIRQVEPGPEVGEIKKKLFEKVLDDPELNTCGKLSHLCRTMKIRD